MVVRPLQEEEKPALAAIIANAFVTPPDFAQRWVEISKIEDTRALFDVDNKIVAGLRIIWNDLWLGAGKVKMVGITNVATPPEQRRKGHLKQLLTAVLSEEREKGYNLSGLYPFEFPFYRKFGYELASATQEIKVSLPVMAGFKSRTAGEWEQCNVEDWPRFQALYNKFCVGRFGLNERPLERWWRRQLFTNFSGGSERPMVAYIWRDRQGQERAYLIYSFKQLEREWSRELRVRDMVWLDEAARHEIYAFIANHDSQAESAVWSTEPGDEFFSLLSDPRQATPTLYPGYMLRILDVERALVERVWPASGDKPLGLSLAVTDEVLNWNHQRTYRLELHPGGENQARAEVVTTFGSERAGLECDVRILAQLYSGYLSPLQAARHGKLKVNRPADLEAAQALFSPPGQPAAFMADHW